MAKPKREPKAWSASQVVAHNMTRARELRGLTQAEIADRLSRFTGATWTAITVAQAEGWVTGARVRQFGANELVALARTFDLPVLYFFMPPEDGPGALETSDSPAKGWPWEYLLLLVWGHAKNFPAVADRAAPWAHVSAAITVPADDVLEREPDTAFLSELARHRDRYTPEDMLAVAFNGLARRRLRQSKGLGDNVGSLAASLRAMADALEAFDNYKPGTFLDLDAIRQVVEPVEGWSDEEESP